MASYFVAPPASNAAQAAVHDRSRCPPACFLVQGGTEYLGEFNDITQAVAVARLRYAHARRCSACEAPVAVSAPRPAVPQPATPA